METSNRQDPLWGGDNIQPYRVGKAASLLSFMEQHSLYHQLQRGEPTCWTITRPGSRTTLDLTLINVSGRLRKCQIYHEDYGSDHRGVSSERDFPIQYRKDKPPRRTYEQRIPAVVRQWTNSFMKDRWAHIRFDGSCSEKSLLAYPASPQGSPISPILYTIYNQKLVNQTVDNTGGASVDYFRSHCAVNTEENIQKLQSKAIVKSYSQKIFQGSTNGLNKLD